MTFLGIIIICITVIWFVAKLNRIIEQIQSDIYDLKAHTGLLEKEKFMRDLAKNDPDTYISLMNDEDR